MPAQTAAVPDPHFAYEVAALRFRLALVKQAIVARHRARVAGAQRRPGHFKAGFDPAQPRDDIGRWTDTGVSDFSAQSRRGGRGPRDNVTPGTAAERAAVNARVDAAIARARIFDPNWRPTPSLTETARGEIAARQAETREAEAFVRRIEEYHANRPALERVRPGGREVGERGSNKDVRTLPPDQFRHYVDFVLRDAHQLSSFSKYPGRAYRLSDGSVVGLRVSRDHGETFEVLISSNRRLVDNGYKVHQK